MTNGQNHADHKLGARIAIIVAIVSFSLYVVNMLIGKANIVYGKEKKRLYNVKILKQRLYLTLLILGSLGLRRCNYICFKHTH